MYQLSEGRFWDLMQYGLGLQQCQGLWHNFGLWITIDQKTSDIRDIQGMHWVYNSQVVGYTGPVSQVNAKMLECQPEIISCAHVQADLSVI